MAQGKKGSEKRKLFKWKKIKDSDLKTMVLRGGGKKLSLFMGEL